MSITTVSFFAWRWSGAVAALALALAVFTGDYLLNLLVIVPLFGPDSLLIQCIVAVPLGAVIGVACTLKWRAVRARVLATSPDGWPS